MNPPTCVTPLGHVENVARGRDDDLVGELLLVVIIILETRLRLRTLVAQSHPEREHLHPSHRSENLFTNPLRCRRSSNRAEKVDDPLDVARLRRSTDVG